MSNSGANLPIPSGALTPQGNWDANTNTPTLVSSVGVEGFFYIVSVSGTTNLNGISDWLIGDWAVFLNGVWNKSSNEDDHKVLVDGTDTIAGYLDEETLDNSQIIKVISEPVAGNRKIEYQLTAKTQPIAINRAPLVTDDETTGLHQIGQSWMDTTTGIVYFAKSLTTNNADWPQAKNNFLDVKPSFIVGNPAHLATLDDLFLHMYSSGVLDGCEITDNGNGTISIAAGSATLRAVDDPHTTLYTVEVNEQLNILLTNNSVNYINLNWSGGSPSFTVSTAVSSFNGRNISLEYVIFRTGNRLDIINAVEQNTDTNTKANKLFLNFSRFIHAAGGSELSETGTLNLGITTGIFNFMLVELPHVAFNSSIAGTANENVYTLMYRDGLGGFTEVADSKLFDTTLYDNNNPLGPDTLANQKWGRYYIYVLHDDPSRAVSLMGQQEFADQASVEDISNLNYVEPSILTEMGSLIGFFTFQKSAANFSNTFRVTDLRLVSSQASAAESWQPAPITLGDLTSSGATIFANTGAGYQISFDAASDDKVFLQKTLDNSGIPYDGSNLALVLPWQLFSTAPLAGENVKWIVTYAFSKADGTENAESKVSGTDTNTIVVDARTANLLYQDQLITMIGLSGAKTLGVTVERNSTGVDADTYPNSTDWYGIELIKQ